MFRCVGGVYVYAKNVNLLIETHDSDSVTVIQALGALVTPRRNQDLVTFHILPTPRTETRGEVVKVSSSRNPTFVHIKVPKMWKSSSFVCEVEDSNVEVRDIYTDHTTVKVHSTSYVELRGCEITNLDLFSYSQSMVHIHTTTIYSFVLKSFDSNISLLDVKTSHLDAIVSNGTTGMWSLGAIEKTLVCKSRGFSSIVFKSCSLPRSRKFVKEDLSILDTVEDPISPLVDYEETDDHKETLESSNQEECCVCMVGVPDIAFMCGHMVCCRSCSDSLKDCPLCMTEISLRLKVFR